MPGTLYVVATPIGNLEDVTLRALRILREVSVIAAEDTRRTARLLQHYSISTRTTSLHEHNEREKTPKLVERLQAGESVALVSDAGTPLISDPGQTLVAAARAAGIRIESIPGPSAVMAAVSALGLPVTEFTFLGFPPSRPKDRKLWFERLAGEKYPVVFFEAPHRIRQTLDVLATVLEADRPVGIARELTKAHEELVVSPISALIDRFADAKGEFTLVIMPAPEQQAAPRSPPDIAVMQAELGQLLENGGRSRRQAIKVLADRHQIGANELYRLLEQGLDRGQKT
jgi:16S rRNA (cytidine1402-2'-O)-methyltransferase